MNVAARIQPVVTAPAPAAAPSRAKAKTGKVVPLFKGAAEPPKNADEQLVALAKSGQTRAYEMLVLKYQNKIVGLLQRIVGEADAQDVAQETFVKAWRALKGFNGDSQFFTWLYRIAVNSAKNHLQARGRRPSYQDIDVSDAELFGNTERLSDNDTPEHLLLSEEIKERVAHVIGHLPADLRRAITLRELQGLSYEEIAEAMSCPVGTVRSRIFRAREAIDVVLQPLLD